MAGDVHFVYSKATKEMVFLCLWRITQFSWRNSYGWFLFVGWCQNPLGGWPSVAEETKRRKSWDTPPKSTTGSARIRSLFWRIRIRVWVGCHCWRSAPLPYWWSDVLSSVWTGELYFYFFLLICVTVELRYSGDPNASLKKNITPRCAQ